MNSHDQAEADERLFRGIDEPEQEPEAPPQTVSEEPGACSHPNWTRTLRNDDEVFTCDRCGVERVVTLASYFKPNAPPQTPSEELRDVPLEELNNLMGQDSRCPRHHHKVAGPCTCEEPGAREKKADCARCEHAEAAHRGKRTNGLQGCLHPRCDCHCYCLPSPTQALRELVGETVAKAFHEGVNKGGLWRGDLDAYDGTVQVNRQILALDAALTPSVPESEPVAWEYRTRMNDDQWGDWRRCEKSTYDRCTAGCPPTEQVRALFTYPPVEPEPGERCPKCQTEIVTMSGHQAMHGTDADVTFCPKCGWDADDPHIPSQKPKYEDGTVGGKYPYLDSLSSPVEGEGARAAGPSTPWPVEEVLRTLADAAEHLLGHYNYDGDGHEVIQAAIEGARTLTAHPSTERGEPDETITVEVVDGGIGAPFTITTKRAPATEAPAITEEQK